MDPIALGTLIIAALGLLAGGLKAFHSYIIKRTKAHFTTEQYSEGPFYVCKIKYSFKQKKASVRSIATWVKVQFINATSSPILLSDFAVFDNCKSKRKPVSLPFRKGEFNHQDATVSDALSMPCRIESQDGVKFYILVDVEIPQILGEILFELYCQDVNLKALEKHTENLRSGALEEMKKDVSIIQFLSLDIPHISVSDPIVRERGNNFLVAPMFGIVPFGAGLEIINACAEKNITYPIAPVPTKYIFEISIGDGRKLRQKFLTKKNPMWFIKTKR